jgi:LysR family transcriptional regulator, transcriptional activator of nhaA
MPTPHKLHQINYNHLLYFWVVARTGSVTKASEELRVAQPTVSTQLRMLEESLGVQLFDRSARGMTLTSAGQMVMRHADEMFRLGNDLVRALSAGDTSQPQPLQVGTADAVPKIMVRSLLMPALQKGLASGIVCREWRVDHLLNELHMHRLDIVLCDQILSPLIRRQTMSYEVGSSTITLCATKDLTQKLRRGFPRSLDGAPMVAPSDNSALREKLDSWFATNNIHPRMIVETEDRSLAHYFATAGVGIVCVASVKVDEVCRQFELEKIGVLKGVSETYYAVAVERAHQHPAVTHICSMAKQKMAVD